MTETSRLFMNNQNSAFKVSRWFGVLWLSGLSFFVNAQPTGRLYDPEPPVDSAYVRVLVVGQAGAVNAAVDGKRRVMQLANATPSDYLVLPAGKHLLTIHAVGKDKLLVSTPLEVVAGRAMTVAYASLQPGTSPQIFEDKANSNKLKALVAVYHMDSKIGPLDVLSADGKTKVFSSVQFGQTASIQVNPINIELMLTKPAEKNALVHTPLSMTQGGTYSLVVSAGVGGKLVARSFLNKIERYTGK